MCLSIVDLVYTVILRLGIRDVISRVLSVLNLLLTNEEIKKRGPRLSPGWSFFLYTRDLVSLIYGVKINRTRSKWYVVGGYSCVCGGSRTLPPSEETMSVETYFSETRGIHPVAEVNKDIRVLD